MNFSALIAKIIAFIPSKTETVATDPANNILRGPLVSPRAHAVKLKKSSKEKKYMFEKISPSNLSITKTKLFDKRLSSDLYV